MKRGQAALEFLTTYGWMLLLVVAVIGAMTYYGLGDTKSAVPSSCNFGQNFECKAFFVDEDGWIGLELESLERDTILLDKSTVLYPGESTYLLADYAGESINVGETFVLLYNPSAHPSSLSFTGKDKFEIKLFYTYDEPEALPRVGSGEVIAEIIGADILVDEYDDEDIVATFDVYP